MSTLHSTQLVKQCARCNALKATSEFHKRRAAEDGLERTCALCIKERRGSSHPAAARARTAKWIAENKARHVAAMLAWRAANPTGEREIVNNRRARKLAAGGELSKGLFDKLLILQRGKCACCGLPLGKSPHMDHIMPLALGGSNTDDNMQLLRGPCNSQKHAKHPVDFMQSRGFLL